MNKKFLAGFLCAVMALGVAGCGGGDKKAFMALQVRQHVRSASADG